MRLPESVTTAFRKLLAPQPMVLLFHDVKGLAWHTARVPETYQVIIGLSWELAEEIDAKMFEQAGRRLSDVAKILEVRHGTRWVIPVLSDYQEPIVGPDIPIPAFAKTRDIVIEPKPLELAEVTRL